MTYCQTQKTERGFTLVELAIVLIIVGLLIGGILKGQELIQNARITATVSQIKGFEAATNTFRDSFNSLPGDLPNATGRLPNCTGTCTVAAAATLGNGFIDQIPGNAQTAEGTAVFSQLAAADLISGASSTPTAGNPVIGDEYPQTEIGGSGFMMGHLNTTVALTATAANTGMLTVAGLQPGAYVAIKVDPSIAVVTTTGGNAMKPTDAAKIDNKIDDGLPNQGSVRVAGNAACASAATAVATYGNTTTNDCTVYVRTQ